MDLKRNRKETHERIRQLRDSINTLEEQLIGLEGQEEKAQHEEIDHLDRYIDAVDTKFSSLQVFWNTLKHEWLKSRP